MLRTFIAPMSVVILVVLLIVAPGTRVAAERSAPGTPVVGGPSLDVPTKLSHVTIRTVSDPIHTLHPLKSLAPLKRKAKLKELVKAIVAIEDNGGAPRTRAQCTLKYKCDEEGKSGKAVSVSRRAYLHKRCMRKLNRCYARDARWHNRRLIIAEAALSAQEQTGVDANLLVAVGRMESDFRNLILLNTACKYKRRNYNCYADCGMTQHHVRGSYNYVMRECKKLARLPKYSFLKSAQELARHIIWCQDAKHIRYHKPVRRCVLNRYNMGPSYKRRERCNRQNRCGNIDVSRYESKEVYAYAYQDCKRRRAKCRTRAAYWKKVSCFEYGARHHVRSKRTCRSCYRLHQIPTRFYPPSQKTDNLTSFLFAPSFSNL